MKLSQPRQVAASCTLGYSYALPYLLIMPMLVIADPKLVFIISVALLAAFLIAGELFFRKKSRKSKLIRLHTRISVRHTM